MNNWDGKHVLILGAARQGVALARWLTRHGAAVTLSDLRTEAELSGARQTLSGHAVRWSLGGHPLELLDQTDLLCLSGGVPVRVPIVQEAVRRGIPVSNDTQIFLETVPCRTVGITGSAGKTTTTALVGAMAERAFSRAGVARGDSGSDASTGRSVYVGGNIGDPLINHVDEMTADDLAILEISSFQLELMSLSPNVAAILNVTPNHLDRHTSMQEYAAAKARLLDFQRTQDAAVLGRDDPGAWNLRSNVKGRLHSFGLTRLEEHVDGAYYDDGILYLHDKGVDIPLVRRDQIQLRGKHNLLNVLAAFAIGHAAGLSLDSMFTAAEEFRGVPHRLEFVRELGGVKWYDDSIATAPERTMAAIRSFEEPIVLLLGGRDKNLPWEELARLVHQRVDHVVIFGEASAKIKKALEAGQTSREKPHSVDVFGHLREAVHKAQEIAEPGDVVLLSPGGTSYDEFKDFEERGAQFRLWVQGLS